MTIYLVTGKLGAGKTLASVGRIRDALFAGRKIATNLDLHLDKLLPIKAGRDNLLSCVRLPDKPCVDDLEALGVGNELMDESKNGLIVLDEMAAWINARTWGDKGRQATIDWLLHSRKKGWDVIFIAQHQDQLDKQVRTALVEYLVTCRRLDRLRIPFVGRFIKILTGGLVSGTMPRIHVGTVRYGAEQNALVADRWWYRGADLYAGYDTRQVFRSVENTDDGHKTKTPPAGLFTYLPPWHVAGRYAGPPPELWPTIFRALMLVCAAGTWVALSMSPRLRVLYAAHR